MVVSFCFFFQHLALKCHLSQRSVLLNDIIQVYSGQHGRAMVFCQTKRECDRLALDELAKLRPQVLHGDIPQAKRDSIMKVHGRSQKIPSVEGVRVLTTFFWGGGGDYTPFLEVFAHFLIGKGLIFGSRFGLGKSQQI